MIESTIKPLPNVTMPLTAEPGKAGSSEKLAAMVQGETPSKPEASKEDVALGMHLDVEDLSKMQKEFNKFLAPQNTTLEYGMDKLTKKMIFKVRDKESKEVIRQIPPEQLVEFAQHIIELLDGKIFNTKA